MDTDLHREELLLVLLASADIALDAESIAATYHSSVDEWRDSLRRAERKGLVEPIGPGLFALTSEGQNKVIPRGAEETPARLDPRAAGSWHGSTAVNDALGMGL